MDEAMCASMEKESGNMGHYGHPGETEAKVQIDNRGGQDNAMIAAMMAANNKCCGGGCGHGYGYGDCGLGGAGGLLALALLGGRGFGFGNCGSYGNCGGGYGYGYPSYGYGGGYHHHECHDTDRDVLKEAANIREEICCSSKDVLRAENDINENILRSSCCTDKEVLNNRAILGMDIFKSACCTDKEVLNNRFLLDKEILQSKCCIEKDIAETKFDLSAQNCANTNALSKQFAECCCETKLMFKQLEIDNLKSKCDTDKQLAELKCLAVRGIDNTKIMAMKAAAIAASANVETVTPPIAAMMTALSDFETPSLSC